MAMKQVAHELTWCKHLIFVMKPCNSHWCSSIVHRHWQTQTNGWAADIYKWVSQAVCSDQSINHNVWSPTQILPRFKPTFRANFLDIASCKLQAAKWSGNFKKLISPSMATAPFNHVSSFERKFKIGIGFVRRWRKMWCDSIYKFGSRRQIGQL